jgi:hypothetical protein
MLLREGCFSPAVVDQYRDIALAWNNPAARGVSAISRC